MNVNFILNLSPNAEGRLDENLVREFGRIGARAAGSASPALAEARLLIRSTGYALFVAASTEIRG